MQINFEVADVPAEFSWNNMTGKAELLVGDDVILLQSPLNPTTHVSFSLKHTWHHRGAGHQVEIEKRRPLFIAGFRPNAFTVKVDGVIVAEATGR